MWLRVIGLTNKLELRLEIPKLIPNHIISTVIHHVKRPNTGILRRVNCWWPEETTGVTTYRYYMVEITSVANYVVHVYLCLFVC